MVARTSSKKLDAAERAGDDGASKKIRAFCPDLVSTSQGEGGVDLWISLTKQMQELQEQQMQLVEAAVRHKRKAAEQEEGAADFGKSISQLRMRFALRCNRRPRSWTRSSLDFADEDTRKAHQDALQVERAAAKRVPELAQAARTKQIERQGDGNERADGGGHGNAHLNGRRRRSQETAGQKCTRGRGS